MSDFVNTAGRGPIGTPTNSPISDGGTMARTQNKANVSQGRSGDVEGTGLFSSSFTDADRQFLYDIHHSKHLDGTPLSLEELVFLRGENVRMQQQAIREFGAGSKTAAWFEEVIAAYDEEIEKAKSPLGSAINALKTAVADRNSKEKDIQEKIVNLIGIMRQDQLMGKDDDPNSQEANRAICQAVDRATDERTDALEDLLEREKRSSGSVSEDDFRKVLINVMGVDRQRQLMGMDDDEEGDKKGERIRGAVVEVIHVVSERRLKAAKSLIEQEKRSPGSVSERKFKELVAAVQGDDRQKQLMGISDDPSGGLEVVLEVMDLILKKRRTAVSDLFKKQAVAGSGITNAQINQAIADYDAIKVEARKFGIAVPEGDFTLGTPDISKP
jgi:hypothetical protein